VEKDKASAEKVIKPHESGHDHVWPCFETIRARVWCIIFD